MHGDLEQGPGILDAAHDGIKRDRARFRCDEPPVSSAMIAPVLAIGSDDGNRRQGVAPAAIDLQA
jgi:hypothetical protein